MTKKQIYLLLDSKSAPLARGVLETAPDGPILQIRVLDGKEDEVAWLAFTNLSLSNSPSGVT